METRTCIYRTPFPVVSILDVSTLQELLLFQMSKLGHNTQRSFSISSIQKVILRVNLEVKIFTVPFVFQYRLQMLQLIDSPSPGPSFLRKVF